MAVNLQHFSAIVIITHSIKGFCKPLISSSLHRPNADANSKIHREHDIRINTRMTINLVEKVLLRENLLPKTPASESSSSGRVFFKNADSREISWYLLANPARANTRKTYCRKHQSASQLGQMIYSKQLTKNSSVTNRNRSTHIVASQYGRACLIYNKRLPSIISILNSTSTWT
jgi:hypothetical protein